MGRRAIFTQQEVFEAADRLAAENKDVTANGLLAFLGGGSLTTIYRHLNDWRESRAGAIVSGPIEIPEQVQAAFAAAWRVAATECAKQIALAQEKSAEQVKEAQEKFNEALQGIEKIEAEAEAEAAENELLRAKILEFENAVKTLSSEKAALNATVEQQKLRIELSHAELEKKDLALKESFELKGQLDAMKSQNQDLLSRLTSPKGK